MRRLIWSAMVFAVAGAALVLAEEAQTPGHVLIAPAGIKWGAPPPIFDQTAKFAVLAGDPSKEGMFTVRLKMPAGYKVMPHFHPTDEHVTVLAGTFALGMGDKFDKATAKHLPPGGYAVLPAQMHHYAVAITAATVQVSGMGPFSLTYVNPADDPSQKPAPKAGK